MAFVRPMDRAAELAERGFVMINDPGRPDRPAPLLLDTGRRGMGCEGGPSQRSRRAAAWSRARKAPTSSERGRSPAMSPATAATSRSL